MCINHYFSTNHISDHEKQVAHGWGGNTGNSEWADEQAGEAIAKADEAEDGQEKAEDAANGDAEAEPTEPEQKVKTLDDYLAEQAEKKLQLGSDLKTRKANEGVSKKWKEGTEFQRTDDEDFIAGTGPFPSIPVPSPNTYRLCRSFNWYSSSFSL